MDHSKKTSGYTRHSKKKISRKVNSLSEEARQRHYYDKFDLDAAGKPKKKPFVHPCLRDAPKITCSKRVRSDDRVGDVYAEISKLQQEGIGLQDQLKIQLALKILDVTKLEITAHRRLLILEYMASCSFSWPVVLLKNCPNLREAAWSLKQRTWTFEL